MSWFTSVGETNLGNVRCELGKTMGVLGFPNVSSLGIVCWTFSKSWTKIVSLRGFFRFDLCSIPTSFWVERFWAHYHSPTTYSMGLHHYHRTSTPFGIARNLWLGSINRTTRGFTNQHRNGQQWSCTWSILARVFTDEAVGCPNHWYILIK